MDVKAMGKVKNCPECKGKRYTVYKRERDIEQDPYVVDTYLKYCFVAIGVHCEICKKLIEMSEYNA